MLAVSAKISQLCLCRTPRHCFPRQPSPDGDGDLPVVIRSARRSPGGTLTAQFHMPGDLDTLGLGGGGGRGGLNALAELLQAGDWGGGAGRRNRTFR